MLRDAGAVKRFHVMRSNTVQTVAEHTWGVVSLVNELVPDASKELLLAALYHDMHERATGDMPSTAKWMYPFLARAMRTAEHAWNIENSCNFEDTLSKAEKAILHFCDYLELLLWSIEQCKLGNRYAMEPLNNILRALTETEAPTKTIELYFNELHDSIPAEYIEEQNERE